MISDPTLDGSSPLTSNFANFYVRGFVGTADEILSGGIVVRGTATEQVLFRALGSDLGKSGIANSLANPVLEVRDNNGVLLASNDNWQDSPQSEEISSLGLTPGSETDAALLLTLVGGLHCSGQGCGREHRHCATGNQGATLTGSTRRLDARRMLPQIFGST